ncbi:MAG TPA: type II secretion system protein GspM [Polyangia bacterium]|nr:type II secretion system protein GspM [Polyangia bacterium]
MSAFDNIRDPVGRLLRGPAVRLAAWWERLAPRERRGFSVLGIVGLSVAVLGGGWYAMNKIGDLRDQNAAIRDALSAIAQHRDEYLEAKARNAVQEARIGNDPPQLTADLETASRAEGVQIAESSERPAVPAGRRYIEHDMDIKIRETDLQSLTKFLKRVETGPRLVFFTRLELKHRYSDDSDKLDVELTATAFERVRDDKTKKKPGGKAAANAEKKE